MWVECSVPDTVTLGVFGVFSHQVVCIRPAWTIDSPVVPYATRVDYPKNSSD